MAAPCCIVTKADHLELAIIIPAAGEGARLGQSKPLVQVADGMPLLVYQLAKLVGLNRRVVVVTGAEGAQLARKIGEYAGLPDERVFINHPHWQRGLGSSIAAGVRALPAEVDGAMIWLCDQWRVSTDDLLQLVARWQAHPSRVVCSRFQGRLGCPAIFPQTSFATLRSLDGDRGAQHLLRSGSPPPAVVEIPAAGIDLDTVEDLRRARIELAGLQRPMG